MKSESLGINLILFLCEGTNMLLIRQQLIMVRLFATLFSHWSEVLNQIHCLAGWSIQDETLVCTPLSALSVYPAPAHMHRNTCVL